MNTSPAPYDLKAAKREYRHRAAPEANEQYQMLVRNAKWWFLPGNFAILRNITRTIAEPKEPSAEKRWNAYLDSLSGRKLANKLAAAAARYLWESLRKLHTHITPPNARPTDDGGVRMSWTINGRYLEIEIAADAATFEWFYRDTKARVSDGGDSIPIAKTPTGLVSRLLELQ